MDHAHALYHVQVAVHTCVSISALPFFTFSILVYAETVRLRFLLDDFSLLLRSRPFSFDLVSQAYLELTAEWKTAQANYGWPTAFFVPAAMTYVAAGLVNCYYARRWWAIYAPYGASFFSVAPPAFFIMYCFEKANKAADRMHRGVVDVILDDAENSHSLRLAKLIELRKLELTLWGRRISNHDILLSILSIAAIYGLVLLGFGWLF